MRWQRCPIDLGFGCGQRLSVERSQTGSEPVDEAVKLSVGKRARHPSPFLRQIGIIVAAGEDCLQGTVAADEARQPLAAAAAWKNTSADLRLTEDGLLTAGIAKIEGERELVAAAPSPAANAGNANKRRLCQAQDEIGPSRTGVRSNGEVCRMTEVEVVAEEPSE